MGVAIVNFSKIETRLKALYVRFWGIPEGGLKALQIKGFRWAINSYFLKNAKILTNKELLLFPSLFYHSRASWNPAFS